MGKNEIMKSEEVVAKCNHLEINPMRVEDCILTIRGQHVMLDRDLAILYSIETKRLNEAVKRNIERFPTDFMFQLSTEEFENWKSQIATSNWMSQDVSSNSITMGARKRPYAFTENGIAMLSGVLRSPTAIAVNIQIMRAFNAMRKFLVSNAQVFQRMETIEHNQLEMQNHLRLTDERVDKVLNLLAERTTQPVEGIFFEGKVYDAYKFVSDLVRRAKKNIVLIDNYIDDSVLTILDKRSAGVEATIYTAKISKQLQLDIDKHNSQYPPIDVRIYTKSHDRFLCIDDAVYHIGASIKDLGKRWFAFSRLNDIATSELLVRISHSE